MGPLSWLLDAQVHVAGSPVLVREIVGNAFGLVSALLGLRRLVWAWPVGMIGNALLLTVFLGGVFATPQAHDLYGQAGRQVFFFAVSVYGWWRWSAQPPRRRRAGPRSSRAGPPAGSGWACWWPPCVGTAAAYPVLAALGSWGPLPGRLDPHRQPARHLRHGPRLGRVLAGLDRGGRGRRAAAAARRVLPLGGHVPDLRRPLRLGLRRLVAHLAGRRGRRPHRPAHLLGRPSA